MSSITGLVNTSYSKDSLQTVLALILLENSVCDYVIAFCFRRKPEDKMSF
jgi:hypothetical protein